MLNGANKPFKSMVVMKALDLLREFDWFIQMFALKGHIYQLGSIDFSSSLCVLFQRVCNYQVSFADLAD